MINFEALFRISYGLYIVSSGDKNIGKLLCNGKIIKRNKNRTKPAKILRR